MIVYTSSNYRIDIDDTPLNKGGEGSVHRIPSMSQYCVKIYHADKRDLKRQQKLAFMVNHKPAQLITPNYIICWPIDIVFDNNRNFVGFVMPLAFPDSELLYHLCRPTLNKNLSSTWHQFYDRKERIGLINRLKLIVNLVFPIYDIHNTNKYVMADFKPQNVMITAQGKISMIDLDSVQIVDNNAVYLAPVATPDYLPPELQNDMQLGRKILGVGCDLFAIAVVFYQLLYGIHPFQVSARSENCTELRQNIALNLFPFGCNSSKISVVPPPHKKFMMLPVEIRKLFILAFENDPTKRPSSEMWGKTLYGFLKGLK